MTARPIRARSKAHCAWVASHPCMISGATDVQAHHLITAQPKAMGKRAGDQWTVPLSVELHRQLHASGDEHKWFVEQGWRLKEFYIDHAIRLAKASPVSEIREAAGR